MFKLFIKIKRKKQQKKKQINYYLKRQFIGERFFDLWLNAIFCNDSNHSFINFEEKDKN